MMKKMGAALGLCMLSACVSVLPQAQAPAALYRFNALEARYAVSDVIVVREPEAPSLFGGRAIASEGQDGALRLVPDIEWADRATRMFQLGLLDVLDGEQTDGAAVASSVGARGRFEVSWRISEFVLKGDRAVCRLELTLMDRANPDALVQKQITHEVTARSGANTDRAQALGGSAGGCIDEAGDFIAGAAGRASMDMSRETMDVGPSSGK